MKEATRFSITDYDDFKNKMLKWADRFNIFCLLDTAGYTDTPSEFECRLAVGCKRKLTASSGTAFAKLAHFWAEKPSWLFGHLGFGLKAETMNVANRHSSQTGFSDMFFFEPQYILELSKTQVQFIGDTQDAAAIFTEILNQVLDEKEPVSEFDLKPKTSRESYLHTLEKIKAHIHRGDCYEMNFCQFFEADQVINPVQVYSSLTKYSPAPFSALYKIDEQYCICSSPERYLQKKGRELRSQPIKGTSRRSHGHDKAERESLLQDQKQRSENVMIVDLVRNDLSRICEKGTVTVEELFGVYTFAHVHQLISSVTGNLSPDKGWVDALQETFPMGSMTGAPKKRVLQLIEEYECCGRGLFSGAIGYINPEEDFDFNVVIRSIFYDAQFSKVSLAAGGGITFNSDPESEFQESLLKIDALVKILQE